MSVLFVCVCVGVGGWALLTEGPGSVLWCVCVCVVCKLKWVLITEGPGSCNSHFDFDRREQWIMELRTFNIQGFLQPR